jgi:hypothetical protein
VTRIPSGPEYKATRALEESFRRMGEERAAEMATERRQARRSRALGPAVGAGLAFLIVGGGVAVGTKVFTADNGSVGAGGRPPTQVQRAPGDRRLAQAAVTDPAQPSARWGLRLYTSAQGETCVVAGRVVAGRLGVVQSGQFTELRADAPGVCGDLSPTHLLATTRAYAAPNGARSLLYGVGDRTVTALAVGRAGRFTNVPIAPDGSFVLVRTGVQAFRGMQLRVRRTGGTSVRQIGSRG